MSVCKTNECADLHADSAADLLPVIRTDECTDRRANNAADQCTVNAANRYAKWSADFSADF